MELKISAPLLEQIILLERKIMSIKYLEQHKSFLKRRKLQNRMQELMSISNSYELNYSEKELKDIIENYEIAENKHPARMIRNAYSAIKYIEVVKEPGFAVNLSQHVNKLLAEGYVEFWEEGKLRIPQENPELEYDSFRNRPRAFNFEAFIELRQKFGTPANYEHPVLKCATILYTYLRSYPFLKFNLQSALLTAYSYVRHSQYTKEGQIPVISLLQKSIMKHPFGVPMSEDDLTAFAFTITREFYYAIEDFEALLEQRRVVPENILIKLNDRQSKALTMLRQHKKFSRNKYMSIFDVSTVTAFRDLKEMVEMDLAKIVGTGRGTTYVLNEKKEDKPLTEKIGGVRISEEIPEEEEYRSTEDL